MIKVLEKLANKPLDYNFNQEEIRLILNHYKRERGQFKVRYAFYRKKSSKGLYIAFIYDTRANSPRRSGVENYWEVVCERSFTDLELLEFAQNHGTQKRRFKVYYYNIIECLQFDDLKYHVETPIKFVEEAKKRGYTNTKFDLIKWENSFKKNLQFNNEPKQLLIQF